MALYRRLLWLFPAPFRERYGAEMLRAIADRRRAAAASGLIALLRFHAGALGDVARNAAAERLWARRADRQPVARGHWVMAFGQDARHAARVLRRTPGSTTLSAATLALGVGSVAAVASLVDAVLIQPLPFPRPHEIVAIRGTLDGENAGISYENLRDIGAGATRLRAWSPFFAQSVNLTGVPEPDRLRGGFVTSGFFDVVGVRAALGRTFGPEADTVNSERLAVLTDGAWRQRFASRPDVVGQPIQLNNQTFTVVGVLPPPFRFPIDYVDVYLPIWATTAGISRDNHNYLGVGRLTPSAPVADASAEATALAVGLEVAYPDVNRGRRARIEPLQQTLVADTTYSLQLLGAMAVIMLVAGCANVAGLQLGSLASRRREIAVRVALGAGRLRIARQFVIESLARASVGSVLGVAAAGAGIRFLVVQAPQDVYGLDRAELGSIALGAGLVASITAGLAAGLPAAIAWTRDGGLAAIGAGDRSVGDRRTSKLRATLVVCQVALASVILVCVGLTSRSFATLTSIDVGFDATQILTMEYRVPRNKYASGEAQQAFHEQVLARVRAVPGVVEAAGVRALPFSGNGTFAGFRTAADGPERRASFNAVSHDYFRTLRIRVPAGRTFEPRDRQDLVVMVSRSLADREWPGQSALGRTLSFDGVGTAEVVGVVGDVRHRALADTSLAAVYTLQTQNPSVFNTLAVRTAGEPMALADAVRRAVWDVDPDQPVWKIRSLASLIDESLATRRFLLQLIAFFGVSAAALAVLGLYGVVSSRVSQRTREIGVRIALGATRRGVLGLVMTGGFRLAGLGIALGLVMALAASRLLERFLFGISARDPVSFAGAGLVLIAATALACWIPGRRALRVDPVDALRD